MQLWGLAWVCTALVMSAFVKPAWALEIEHHPPLPRAYWRKSESRNFIVHATGNEAARTKVLETCETLRERLAQQWLAESLDVWASKCHVVLHTSARSYQQAIGNALSGTRGSTWIGFDKRDARRVATRRIDLLCDKGDDDLTALPHELTHALLVDQFAGEAPPRWLDEGVALLADPVAKQQLHLRDAKVALVQRKAFAMVELLRLDGYPAQTRIPAFYGQSLALTQMLTQRDSADKLLTFALLSRQVGHDQALRDVYKIDGLAELERLWQMHAAELAVNP